MYLFLLRSRVWLWWTELSRGEKGVRRVLGLAGVALLITVMCGFIAVSTAATAHALEQRDPTALPALLSAVFAAGVTFTLFMGASSTIHRLYLASDLDLLLAAPVPLRDLYLLKLTETALTGGLPGLAALAGAAGYGLALGAGWTVFALAVPTTLLLVTLSAAVSMLLIMLVMRVMPARRLQGAVTILGAVIAAGGWLLFQTVRPGGDVADATRPALRRWGEASSWSPTTWAAGILDAASDGDWPSAAGNVTLLGAAALAAAGLAFVLFRYTFTVNQGRLREAHPRGRSRTLPDRASASPSMLEWSQPATHERRRGVASLIPAPVWAIAVKELRVLPRDMRYLSGFIMPLVMGLFWAFRITGRTQDEGGVWTALIASGYIIFFVGPQISIPAMAREGKSYALLRSAPVRAVHIIAGKILAGFLPLAGVLWVVVIASAVWFGAPWLGVLSQLVLVAWLAAGTVAANTVIGAMDPRFEADNPQRSIGCGGSLLSFVLSAWYLGTSGAIYVVLWLMARDDPVVPPIAGVIVVAILMALALGCIATITAMGWSAARRLEAWEET